ncbi:protein kinase [Pseudoxanthomonas sp. LjRoot143]|uniref:protein kinase domain-containing protein n=1 Tax=Pseudoxanthomonas sp. LjRoot143 TaxID=3342266 RepID=UPI003ED1604B
MGTVYEAWRDDGQYRQRVALKCMRHELSSPRLVESFLREREALASLEHPGIAALIDGGIDVSGRPWFAMRYVDGMPIDQWCDRHRASVEQRIDLLVQACDALAYAHARLVLHQDIKPTNLLVTPDAQVQLLDFGLTASLAVDTPAPRVAISEGYAPPEATSDDRPTVASDLWSLGMVMYRLLCDRLPVTASPWWLVKEGTPPRAASMSQVAGDMPAAAACVRGHRDGRTLAHRLAGDLDAIALRCIALDPAQRYASAIALRDDLLAWRRRRPVQARNGGVLYRGGRFVSRHRIAVGLASLLLVTCVVGAGVAAWQVERNAREAAATLALSDVFEQTLGIATLSGLGDTALTSRELLQDTEGRIRAVAGDRHPAVLSRGLAILARNYTVLGDYPRGTALAREAAALTAGDPVADAQDQATLASLLNLQGKHAEAQQVARLALAALPDDERPVRLQVMMEIARSEWNELQRAQAQKTLEQAMALAQQSGNRVAQAELHRQRGSWHARLRHIRDAESDMKQAIALAGASAPLVANEARHSLAGLLLLEERATEAVQVARVQLEEARKRLGEAHPLVGRAWWRLANAQCVNAQLDACATSIGRADVVVRQSLGESHPDYADVLRIRSQLAAWRQPESDADIPLLRRAYAIMRAWYPRGNEHTQKMQTELGGRLLAARPASPQARARNLDEALALLEAPLARQSATGVPLRPNHRSTLAQALLARDTPGDRARVRALLAENLRVMAPYPQGYSARFSDGLCEAQLLLREGDAPGAEARVLALLPGLARHQAVTSNRFSLRDAWLLRAEIAAGRGDRRQARVFLVDALRHTKASFGPRHPAARRLEDMLSAFDRTGRLAHSHSLSTRPA